MEFTVGDRAQLPVACTLDAADGAQRVLEWQALLTEHGAGTTRQPRQLTLHFTGAAAVTAELHRLVASERQCCAFVEWAVRTDGDQVEVVIAGEPGALDTFAFTTPG